MRSGMRRCARMRKRGSSSSHQAPTVGLRSQRGAWLALIVVITAAASAAHAAQAAPTLAYCSEGSPETFNPALSTAVSTYDASAKPVFDRLVQYQRGTTRMVLGLAESWEL